MEVAAVALKYSAAADRCAVTGLSSEHRREDPPCPAPPALQARVWDRSLRPGFSQVTAAGTPRAPAWERPAAGLLSAREPSWRLPPELPPPPGDRSLASSLSQLACPRTEGRACVLCWSRLLCPVLEPPPCPEGPLPASRLSSSAPSRGPLPAALRPRPAGSGTELGDPHPSARRVPGGSSPRAGGGRCRRSAARCVPSVENVPSHHAWLPRVPEAGSSPSG